MLINARNLSGTGRGISPMTNITPFTYSDGLTFQRLLYMMKEYMLEVMEPHYTGEITRVIEEFNSELDRIETQYGKDYAEMNGIIEDFIKRIEEYVRTWVDPVAKAAVKKYLDEFIANPGTLELFGGIFASKVNEDTPRKQAELYATFFNNLRNGTPVSICALGDSTTYGYDMSSADRIVAPAGTLPDGSIHRHDRAPKQYPAVLQSRLLDMYGAGKVSVINRGYSGDTTKQAYDRWISPHGAGLTLISLGINDASRAGFTLKQHLEFYEKLILREINEYESAVVVLTPFKQNYHNPSKTIDAYRVAVVALANKYGVPVVDTESWLSGFGTDVYALNDGTHMNGKGYEIIGTRLAALFINDGPMVPFTVAGGSRLATRPTLDNMILGPVGAHSMAVHSGGGAIRDGVADSTHHMSALMKDGASIYYAFYAETADLICHFTYGIFTGNTLKIELDFGIDQPTNVAKSLVGIDDFDSLTVGSSILVSSNRDQHVTKLNHDSKVLHIVTPGWHTIKFTATGNFPATMDGLRTYAIEFLNYREYLGSIKQNSFRLFLPEVYNNEKDSITSFRIPWRSVMDVLGLVDWGKDIYKAPALKVTLRTWDQGAVEYILVVNPGRWAHSDVWTLIQHFAHLRTMNHTGTLNAQRLRELDTVTFDKATWELVFNLKTTGKLATPNFVVDISVL